MHASDMTAEFNAVPVTEQENPRTANLSSLPIAEIVRLELGRHAIDMLDILEQKTKCNFTSEEAAMVESVLHQLRMAFVEATKGK